MRQLIFLLFCVLGFGCNSFNDAGKYFDYDEIVYYKNSISESETEELYDKQSLSMIDSMKFGVILGDIPFSINDTSFVSRLNKMGYENKVIEKKKYNQINQIFRQKHTFDNISTSCIYIYRDILIFKKQNKIIGIAKICFECGANHIVGTKMDTKNFGQKGDYEKLFDLIRH